MQKYLTTTWRLWKLLKPFHKDFYIQFFLIILGSAISVLSVLAISKIITHISEKNFDQAYTSLFLWLITMLAYIIISYIKDRHSNKNIDYSIQQFLEEFSFKKIFKLNISQYTEDHSAIKFQVINRGEIAVENIVSTIVLEIIPTVASGIFSFIAISFYSKTVAVWCVITLVVAVVWTKYFTDYHRPFIKKDIDNSDAQKKIRSEAFQHLSLIKNLNMDIYFLKKYLKNRKEFMEYRAMIWLKNINHINKRWTFFNVSRFGSNLILITLAFKGSIAIGAIYAVWRWIDDLYNNIGTLTRAMRQLPLRFVELEKYLEIIDKQPDFEEASDTKFVDGDIVFKNLSFKYPKSESNVLNNINIKIPQGSKVAFVGHSGSGKTTITRLLLRAYDYNNLNNKNEEKINPETQEENINNYKNKNYSGIKINNIELKDIDAGDLRKHIGYVEQHVDLFDDTIKNNILFGVDEKVLKDWEKGVDGNQKNEDKNTENSNTNKSIVEQKLEEISKLARIDEFYHRLGESKFETEIGERGIKLSGGERQRIGIARAIIKNPAILIFDEATSSLDTVNEKYIKEAIDNVSKGRTTIIIAHRLSTIVDSDIIFVMDKGEVVASGSHAELLETSKHYQNLIEHQELK